MAVGALTGAFVYIDTLDASPFVSSISSPFTVDMLDATTIAEGGFSKMVPGLRHGEIGIEGFQDFAAGGFYETINQADIGSAAANHLVTVGTTAAASAAAGDPVCFVSGPIDTLEQGDGKVGELLKMAAHAVQGAPFNMGVLALPSATKTITGTGTAIAFAGPTATQAWYAGLHVFSGSGGNLIVKIQSDDNGGFSSATDRITFTTATGATYEQKSVAGSFSSETQVRAQWSVSAGTFTFAVVVGLVSLI